MSLSFPYRHGSALSSEGKTLFSLLSFTLASTLCGTAQSLGMLIAARIFQGLAGGGLLAKVQSLLFEILLMHAMMPLRRCTASHG